MMSAGNGNSAGQQNNGMVCRDFLRKVCSRGRNCKYVHPEDAEKKLEFCHDFQNSTCRRPNCKFIHCKRDEEEFYLQKGVLPSSVDEIGNRGENSAQLNPGICRDFLNNKCDRGARCKFLHQSEGDAEYDRMRAMRGARGRGSMLGAGGFGSRGAAFPGGNDSFGMGAASRRPGPLDAYRAISRYGRPGAYDGTGYLDFEKGRQGGGDLETEAENEHLRLENTRLSQKVEVLRKQVDDLTSTNEILLQQNAQLRTGKAEVAPLYSLQ